MQLELTQAHNTTADALIERFSVWAAKNGIEQSPQYLAAFLGLIGGRELLHHVAADKIEGMELGSTILTEEVDEAGPLAIGFLFRLGEVLKFKPVKDGGLELPHEVLVGLLVLIKSHEQELEALFQQSSIPQAERTYVALLAVAKAVQLNGNDQPPFTFSDAASLAIDGMVHGSKTVS